MTTDPRQWRRATSDDVVAYLERVPQALPA